MSLRSPVLNIVHVSNHSIALKTQEFLPVLHPHRQLIIQLWKSFSTTNDTQARRLLRRDALGGYKLGRVRAFNPTLANRQFRSRVHGVAVRNKNNETFTLEPDVVPTSGAALIVVWRSLRLHCLVSKRFQFILASPMLTRQSNSR